jgi:hypothetical protein
MPSGYTVVLPPRSSTTCFALMRHTVPERPTRLDLSARLFLLAEHELAVAKVVRVAVNAGHPASRR